MKCCFTQQVCAVDALRNIVCEDIINYTFLYQVCTRETDHVFVNLLYSKGFWSFFFSTFSWLGCEVFLSPYVYFAGRSFNIIPRRHVGLLGLDARSAYWSGIVANIFLCRGRLEMKWSREHTIVIFPTLWSNYFVFLVRPWQMLRCSTKFFLFFHMQETTLFLQLLYKNEFKDQPSIVLRESMRGWLFMLLTA